MLGEYTEVFSQGRNASDRKCFGRFGRKKRQRGVIRCLYCVAPLNRYGKMIITELIIFCVIFVWLAIVRPTVPTPRQQVPCHGHLHG